MSSDTRPTTSEGACCEACARPTDRPASRSTTSQPIRLDRRARRPAPPGGATDRHVTLLAIALAAGFVALALVAIVAPGGMRQGTWVPLHLLLAGAAPTAIAGVMPFFSAAVSGAPPANVVVRLAGVLGVASGGVLIVGGRMMSADIGTTGSLVAGAGGIVYIGGLFAVAAATLWPLRLALGPRRFFMGAVYGIALLNVVLGASLATTFLLGWAPVVAGWASLKPAHAWFNLFGFISLVIAGSLLHLLPTVAGARIRRTAASMVTFAALSAGPLTAAAGYALGSDALALAGAGLLVGGALALAWHAVIVLRSRGRWSTDRQWHIFTTWSLVAGIGWFVVAAAIAGGQVLAAGAAPAGWSLAPLLVPLAVGWAGQVLVGSWSHLMPAVGPGTLEQHARQREILGRGGIVRLALLNGGAVAVVVADAVAMPQLALIGGVAVVATGLSAVALLAGALVSLRVPVPAPRAVIATD